MRRLLICFCKEIDSENIDFLNALSEEENEVHLFNGVKKSEIDEIDIKQIINSLNIEKKSEIIILSDDFNYIKKLWNKESWKFKSFIYLGEMESKKEICLENKINLFSKKDFNLYLFEREAFIEKYIEYYDIFLEHIKDNSSFGEYFGKIESTSNTFVEIIKSSKELTRKKEKIESLVKNACEMKKIYIYSLLVEIYKEARYIEEILILVKDSTSLTKENKFFLIYQMIRREFNENKLGSSRGNELIRDIYFEILNGFKERLNIKENKKIMKRDKNLVVIFTNQFLGLNHAPTKTVLDRAYNLIKKMNKRVLIINTRELLTMRAYVPLYNIEVGNVVEEYKNLSSYKYKDIEIPFYQSEFTMPEENEISQIIGIIKKYKPSLIFTVGGMNITADICSTMIPVATISTVFSSIPLANSDFYVVGRKIQENDLEYMRFLGKEKESLIGSRFTFDFKEQKNIFTRSDLELPEDRFIAGLIGARLQKECDEEFLCNLEKLAKEGLFFISIGDLTIEESKYPNLFNNFKNLGFQEDVLAVLENIDIYINPKRSGGGSSAAEALYKGKPVITLKCGDVAIAVDKDFIVNNYEEMRSDAIEYMLNSKYYEKKSEIAKEVARDLLDTEKHFRDIYKKILNSKKFY